MPSIRRSLIGYFLLLMGVTFLGVGLIVDGFVSAANAARQAADEARLRQDYEVRCRDSADKFDEELLTRAQSLAKELRKEYSSSAFRASRNELARRNQLATATLPLALGLNRWSVVVAGTLTSQRLVLDTVYWRTVLMMQTEEFIGTRPVDLSEHPGLFQIHLPRTGTGRPTPVRPARQAYDLPLDADALDRDADTAEEHHAFDTVAVPGFGEFRRVVYSYPLFDRLRGVFPQRNPRDAGRSGPPPARPAMQPPALYVQYFRPKADLDAILAAHHDKLDDDLAALDRETANYLRRFLGLLLLVGAAGFVGLFAGSWWIVRRGLKPLATLTTAVSRVSEKDFLLPVAAADLSEDLLPIHARLTHTLDSLRRAFEREKQAVGDISHELRTPLAALRTTLDVALRKPRDAEQYRGTLSDCREIARQLSRLVDRILTLAALDSGQGERPHVAVDVSDLAMECVAVIRPLAESHDLTFRAEVTPGVMAETDPDRLREVMMNLLHNAVEYNRPGGKVTLCVSAHDAEVRVAVVDTGIGMVPAVRGQIFERFYRADASRHATGVHAGLGLAIVKEYLTRLGGTIHVRSEPDRGTTFTVTLPA
jgi:signal transduction histidine kinase